MTPARHGVAPRCAPRSLAIDEPLPGTASTVRTWLLVEDPGPWGDEPLRDSRLPRAVVAALTERARRAGVRTVLIRQHGRSHPVRRHCYVASSTRGQAWVEATLLDDVADVLDIDLAAAAAGRSVGLTPFAGPLFLGCTHGRHDACCAIEGRPLAHAITALHPERSWECTHIGGDRFAGNLVCLPEGVYYGRVTPTAAARITSAYLRGQLDLDHLRGRSTDPIDVQVADHALRRRLGAAGIDDVRPRALERLGAEVAVTLEVTDGRRYTVRLRRGVGEPQQLTCGLQRLSAPPRWDVLGIGPA